MKMLLLAVAIGTGGGAAYFGTLAKNSYSSYSAEQLQMLEEGFVRLERPTEDQLYSRELLETDKRRRVLFPALALAAVLAAVGAFFSRSSGEGFSDTGSAEADRFAATVGNPLLVLEGARNKAAALLGVSPGAPPVVIEAALKAQLESRDPARMKGVAPDLKAMVLEQREALIKARDLLLAASRE